MFRVKQCSNLIIPKISQVVMLFMGAFGLVSVQNSVSQEWKGRTPTTITTNRRWNATFINFVKKNFHQYGKCVFKIVNFEEILQ